MTLGPELCPQRPFKVRQCDFPVIPWGKSWKEIILTLSLNCPERGGKCPAMVTQLMCQGGLGPNSDLESGVAGTPGSC